MKIPVPRRTAPTARRAVSLHTELGRMLDDLWRGFEFPARRVVAKAAAFAPRMDYCETDDEIRIDAELPGLDAEDIDVSLEDGVLTIEGDRQDEHSEASESKGSRYAETFRGHFERRIRVPDAVDAEAVRAIYKNGLLSVTLPKPPEAEPEVRTIPISVG
jgi:HSP20 family protein